MKCVIAECGNNSRWKGHCIRHFGHYYAQRTDKLCVVEGCGGGLYAKGYCLKHYSFFKRDTHYEDCKMDGCTKRASRGRIYCCEHRVKHEKGLRLSEDNRVGVNNINWRGGVSDYPNHNTMKKIRKERLVQTGGQCEDCGIVAKGHHLHHLDFSKNNHSPENLKLLCVPCHKKYHSKK